MPGQGIAPAPRRIAAGLRAPCGRGRRRFRVSFRRALFRAFWRLGFRQSSFRRIARIPRRAAPDTRARPPVSWHAAVPARLSATGQPSDPQTPPPVHARYASDTAVRHVAQSRQHCATLRSRPQRQAAKRVRTPRSADVTDSPRPLSHPAPPPRRKPSAAAAPARCDPHQPRFSRGATIPPMSMAANAVRVCSQQCSLEPGPRRTPMHCPIRCPQPDVLGGRRGQLVNNSGSLLHNRAGDHLDQAV